MQMVSSLCKAKGNPESSLYSAFPCSRARFKRLEFLIGQIIFLCCLSYKPSLSPPPLPATSYEQTNGAWLQHASFAQLPECHDLQSAERSTMVDKGSDCWGDSQR